VAGPGPVASLRTPSATPYRDTAAAPLTQEVDGKSAQLTLTLEWTYAKPGTYFPTALVESHRDGDVDATSRRIPNLGAARVVVTESGHNT
jgi:hypothetical protein